MVAANFVWSVFKDVGLPDCIVSDSDTRFVAELWTALHETLGTRLVFWTPHHHHTTAKVKWVNGCCARPSVLLSTTGQTTGMS